MEWRWGAWIWMIEQRYSYVGKGQIFARGESRTSEKERNNWWNPTQIGRLEEWKNLWLAHICIFWTICFISTEIHYFEDTLYFFTKIFLRLPSKQIIEREHVKDVNAASWSWAHKTLQFFHSSILRFFPTRVGFPNFLISSVFSCESGFHLRTKPCCTHLFLA